MNYKLFTFLVLFFVAGNLYSQKQNAYKDVIKHTNVDILKQISKKNSEEFYKQLKEGEELLESKKWLKSQETKEGNFFQFRGVDKFGLPIYYSNNNVNAAKTIGTNKLWKNGGLGLDLAGDSMYLGLFEVQTPRLSHQELVGRITQIDTVVARSQHATHVSGTMIGTGINPSARGMYNKAKIWAWDSNNDEAELALAGSMGLLLSNHSYGRTSGWTYNNGTWYWWGNTNISTTEDYKYGFYDNSTRTWDQVAFNAPYYLIVKAAGNDRGAGPTPGTMHYVVNPNTGLFNASTIVRDKIGGSTGFDCIPTNGVAKNVLTVGAVNAIPNGYTGPSSVVMTEFSGWGPTDDGRIKPDVVSDGVNLISASSANDQNYASLTGTSMATPSTTGSLLLLQELYYKKFNQYMKAATLKGLIINTANEAGPTEGPDYMFGWGLTNIDKAANTIIEKNNTSLINEYTLNNNDSIVITVFATGASPLVATICWTDPIGNLPPDTLDPSNRILVNDLDIRINKNTTIYKPYVLNPLSPSTAAIKGDNVLDNVEKIYINAPTTGFYTIKIKHKGNLVNGNQNFSLIVTGIATKNIDAAITNFTKLFSGCDFTEASPIQVKITNKGINALANIKLKYILKNSIGNVVSNDSINIPSLNIGQNLSFNHNLNLTSDDKFVLTTQLIVPNDESPLDNTKVDTLISNPTIVNENILKQTFDAITNFNDIGWKIEDVNGDNCKWELRVGSAASQFAYSGFNSIRYGVQYPTNAPNDWLYTSCYQLDSGSLYQVKFHYRAWKVERSEKMELRIGESPNSTAMNTLIHEFTPFNNVTFLPFTKNFQVNKSGSYYIGWHTLSDTAGRFIYMDDFSIQKVPAHDLVVRNVYTNTSSCDYSNQTPIKVKVYNNGINAQTNFNLNYMVYRANDILQDSGLVEIPNLNSGDSTEITFNMNLADFGDYTVKVFTDLYFDQNSHNDSIIKKFYNAKADITNTSYLQTFDGFDMLATSDASLNYIGWSIENSNQDDKTWFLETGTGSRTVAYQYSATNTADDWLFSNCIKVPKDKKYRLSFRYAARSGGYVEKMRVCLLNGPSSSQVIDTLTDLHFNNTVFKTSEAVFSTPDTGIYYLGFYAYSAPDQFAMYVDNVKITEVSANDMSINSIVNNISYCEFTDKTPVAINLYNRGYNNQNNIPLHYDVYKMYNTTPEFLFGKDTLFNNSIALGEIKPLNILMNLSLTNTKYKIIAYTKLIGDNEITNDTIITYINNIKANIAGNDTYTQGFEVENNPEPIVSDILGWSTEDVNNDGLAWEVRNSASFSHLGTNSMRSPKSTTTQNNDWLFSSCLALKPNQRYRMELWYRGRASTTPEKMKINIGKSQSSTAMTQQIVDLGEFNHTTHKKMAASFNVNDSGLYYIGFNSYSEANMGWIYIDDFLVSIAPAKDASISKIEAAVTSCDFSTSTPINIEVFNEGNDTIKTPIKVTYTAKNAANTVIATNDIYTTGTILPGQKQIVTTNIDINNYGNYYVTAVVTLTDDYDLANNTKTVTILNQRADLSVAEYNQTFENVTKFSEIGWTGLDVANDKSTWSIAKYSQYAHAGTNELMFSYHQTNTGNDWIFSNCLKLYGGNYYKISFWYKAYSKDYDERMKVMIGSSPDSTGMEFTLMNSTIINNVEYKKAELVFNPELDGLYYIGWYANSKPYSRYIFIDDIKVSNASANDIAITNISTNTSSCDFTSTTPYTIKVSNLGGMPQANVNVEYSLKDASNNIINSGNQIISTIETLESSNVTINLNIVNAGKYNLFVNAKINNDADTLNNKVTYPINNFNYEVNQNAYIQKFESVNYFSDAGWLNLNLNGDTRYWGVSTSQPNAHSGNNSLVYYTSTASNEAANDWIMSNCLHLYPNKQYTIGFYYKCGTGLHNLHLKLGTSNTPESMTTNLVSIVNDTNSKYQKAQANFTVSSEGDYYLGWYTNSIANQGSMYIEDVVLMTSPTIQASENPICANYPVQLSVNTTDSVIWYSNAGLSSQIYNGSILNTSVNHDSTFYAIKKFMDIKSIGSSITLNIKNSMPLVNLGDTIYTNLSSPYTLNAGIGYSSYLWNTGSQNASINVSSEGWYGVTAMDANNCESSDSVYIKQSTKINEIFNSNSELTIFPNPNKGEFTVITNNETEWSLEVLNIHGIKVYEHTNITNKEYLIKVNHLAAGVYTLKAKSKGKISTYKIIIK